MIECQYFYVKYIFNNLSIDVRRNGLSNYLIVIFLVERPDVPEQDGGNDCGIFLIANAMAILSVSFFLSI